MAQFPLHTPETAPEEARGTLSTIQEKMGFLPNFYAKLATAPAALDAYMTVSDIFAKTSLTSGEQQTVLLTTAVENQCEFCVAAHSGGARQVGVPQEVVDAIRNRAEVPDSRLRALSEFTQRVVRERGEVSDGSVQRFLDAGFTQQNVLEVVLGVSLKTLSNYANHIVETPLNKELASFEWKAA